MLVPRFNLKTRSIIYAIISLAIFTNKSGYAQILTENFSDGDFTTNPSWGGETSKYIVNGSNQLQTNGTAISDTAYLSVSTGNLDFSQTLTWEFYFNLNFNPSTTNNARIYLVSNNSNLRGTLNGYFIRIGENSIPDRLQFYKQSGTTTTLLFSGSANTFEFTPQGRVRVTRTSAGLWTFESDATGGSNFITEGAITDNSFTASSFFGFWSKYTSTNNLNFRYDDIVLSGATIIDATPPTVVSVTTTSANELSVLFNEPVSTVTAQNIANYSANLGIGAPISATVNVTNPNQVDLVFAGSFTNGTTYNLTVQNIQDLAGNTMVSSNHNFVYFIAVAPNVGDIIINEIFADPTPQIGLPNAEYVELYNRSSQIYNIGGWKLSDPSSTATLPNHILMPGAYVTIAPNSASFEFSIFPNTIFVSSLPSLNNSSDLITLMDNTNAIIDQVEYFDTWYQDAVKKGGGYSLELKNPTLPCSGAFNWIASNDPNGGTPGTQNSVYTTAPDGTPPVVVSSNVVDKNTIQICFNESIDATILNTSMMTVNNGVSVATFSVSQDLLCLTLTILPSLDTGVIYTVSLSGIKDCSGNAMLVTQREAILPHLPKVGDIIINELLFNPYTGGSDFVEVYNNSTRYIDLKGFLLANSNDGSVANLKPITYNFLLRPAQFAVITKDSNNVKANYLSSVTGRFIQLSTLPSYNNDSSTVYVLKPDSIISDAVSYSEKWHFSLVKDFKGKSLERLDYNRASQDAGNWHTTAQLEGWATPGKVNSQYFPNQLTDDAVATYPEIFSPDNDGFEDVLNIAFNVNEPGYVCNVTIFDREGRVVKLLVQNQLLGIEGVFTWDGTDNKLEKARIGVYIIYFEVFNLQGEVSVVKKAVVLGGRF